MQTTMARKNKVKTNWVKTKRNSLSPTMPPITQKKDAAKKGLFIFFLVLVGLIGKVEILFISG